MPTLFARHDVEDFDQWKQAYDNFEGVRRSMGVTAQGVYRATDDPNNVTIYHDFDSAEEATAFAESPRLREAMVNAGVKGEPALWIADKA